MVPGRLYVTLNASSVSACVCVFPVVWNVWIHQCPSRERGLPLRSRCHVVRGRSDTGWAVVTGSCFARGFGSCTWEKKKKKRFTSDCERGNSFKYKTLSLQSPLESEVNFDSDGEFSPPDESIVEPWNTPCRDNAICSFSSVEMTNSRVAWSYKSVSKLGERRKASVELGVRLLPPGCH